MPIYNFLCLYCDNCDSRLAGRNDHMTICSRCGNLMLRLDDDFFWESFDKNHFQFIAQGCQCHPPSENECR